MTTVKSRPAPTIWKKLRWKLLCLPILKITTEIIWFWGTLSQNYVCMDFEPYFHNWDSVHPKSIILVQMTNLYMIFHVVVSVYRFVKIWNSPQFAAEFRNGLFNVVIGSRLSRKQVTLVPLLANKLWAKNINYYLMSTMISLKKLFENSTDTLFFSPFRFCIIIIQNWKGEKKRVLIRSFFTQFWVAINQIENHFRSVTDMSRSTKNPKGI